jgi:hypothetical protein
VKSFPLLCGLVIFIHAIASWSLINPHGLEPISDEGAYVTLAKALATTGQYKMICLPGEPYHTKYPILFPWMLSWIWRLSESFPANVRVLRLVNIIFGAGFILSLVPLVKRLFAGDKGQTLLLICLCAVNPAVLSSSTTLSSEASYLFFSSIAIFGLLKLDEQSWSSYWFLISLGSFVAASYIRAPAVALLAAATIHLLLRRRWRQSLGIGLGTVSCVIPWLYWCHIHNDSARFPEYIFYNDYVSDFWKFVSSHGLIPLLTSNAVYILIGIPKSLLYPFQTDLYVITQLTAWLGFLTLALLLLGFTRSFQTEVNRLIHWYVLLYIAMLLLWPYPAGERFLEPLLPFFYWFILLEIRHFGVRVATLLRAAKRQPSRLVSVAVPLCIFVSWAIAGLFCLGLHAQHFVINKRQQLTTYETAMRDMNESFRWVQRETSPSDCLMANLYSLYYLHTNRKTAPLLFDSTRELTAPKLDEMPIWKHRIRYLIVGDLDFGVYVPTIVSAMRQELRRVISANRGLVFEKKFMSQLGKYEIYRIERVDEPR